ncbi:MAG: hypothetical protein ACRD18_08100 [Terriglobia bacterium]
MISHRFYDDPEFAKRVGKEVRKTAVCVDELKEKFEAWGFSPIVDSCVQELIDESGYRVSAELEEDAWTVEIEPEDKGKFDPAGAQHALDDIDMLRSAGDWHREGENEDVFTLADALYSAARSSLKKHGDLRDAVNEMGDYVLRDRSHPNAGTRNNLRRILYYYVSAREQYNDYSARRREANRVRAGQPLLSSYARGERIADAEWFDERTKEFQNVAAEYLETPNAHTRWLTNEICAWLVRPYLDFLFLQATELFPPNRIGARRKEPWCSVVPLCVSALLFLLSVALITGCYLFFTPVAGYAAAGLCGLAYARRYVQLREFGKERKKITHLWHKACALYSEVENGKYNAGEVIRRFRELAAHDLLLPSIFVSVISLPEVKPAKDIAVPG